MIGNLNRLSIIDSPIQIPRFPTTDYRQAITNFRFQNIDEYKVHLFMSAVRGSGAEVAGPVSGLRGLEHVC